MSEDHPANYHHHFYEMLEQKTNFSPQRLQNFIYVEGNETDNEYVLEKNVESCQNFMKTVKNQAETMKQYSDIEVYEFDQRNQERELASAVDLLFKMINIHFQLAQKEMLMKNFSMLHPLICSLKHAVASKKKEKFIPKLESYAKPLADLQMKARKERNAKIISHFDLECKIKLFKAKVETFEHWKEIETCKVVIDGLNKIDADFRKEAWEKILLEPIEKLRLANLTSDEWTILHQISEDFEPEDSVLQRNNKKQEEVNEAVPFKTSPSLSPNQHLDFVKTETDQPTKSANRFDLSSLTSISKLSATEGLSPDHGQSLMSLSASLAEHYASGSNSNNPHGGFFPLAQTNSKLSRPLLLPSTPSNFPIEFSMSNSPANSPASQHVGTSKTPPVEVSIEETEELLDKSSPMQTMENDSMQNPVNVSEENETNPYNGSSYKQMKVLVNFKDTDFAKFIWQGQKKSSDCDDFPKGKAYKIMKSYTGLLKILEKYSANMASKARKMEALRDQSVNFHQGDCDLQNVLKHVETLEEYFARNPKKETDIRLSEKIGLIWLEFKIQHVPAAMRKKFKTDQESYEERFECFDRITANCRSKKGSVYQVQQLKRRIAKLRVRMYKNWFIIENCKLTIEELEQMRAVRNEKTERAIRDTCVSIGWREFTPTEKSSIRSILQQYKKCESRQLPWEIAALVQAQEAVEVLDTSD